MTISGIRDGIIAEDLAAHVTLISMGVYILKVTMETSELTKLRWVSTLATPCGHFAAVVTVLGGTKPKTQHEANGSSIVCVDGVMPVSIVAWKQPIMATVHSNASTILRDFIATSMRMIDGDLARTQEYRRMRQQCQSISLPFDIPFEILPGYSFLWKSEKKNMRLSGHGPISLHSAYYMSSLTYTTAQSEKDLLGILKLQKNNLSSNLTPEEISSQGFVTVAHSFANLKKMNDIEQHVICKEDDNVVAYVLAMTPQSQHDIPVLVPMFEAFEKVMHKGRKISTYRYIIVGQVCVDKNYRGQGIFDRCYEEYRRTFHKRYDFAITEIDSRNARSISAHKRIGFSEAFRYRSADKVEWSIVIWQWS
jgi:GNAT superfamily N-acetyltransferase